VPSRPVYAELSLRGEIENVLQREAMDYKRGHMVATAWTVAAIVAEIEGTNYWRVLSELIDLKEEGRVTRRRSREGNQLWKLTDVVPSQWLAVQGMDHPK
jgi:hypothetical protein